MPLTDRERELLASNVAAITARQDDFIDDTVRLLSTQYSQAIAGVATDILEPFETDPNGRYVSDRGVIRRAIPEARARAISNVDPFKRIWGEWQGRLTTVRSQIRDHFELGESADHGRQASRLRADWSNSELATIDQLIGLWPDERQPGSGMAARFFSLTDDHRRRVADVVTRGVLGRRRATDLTAELAQLTNSTTARAKFVFDDATMQYSRSIHDQKAASLGYEHFQYFGPRDAITRPFCAALLVGPSEALPPEREAEQQAKQAEREAVAAERAAQQAASDERAKAEAEAEQRREDAQRAAEAAEQARIDEERRKRDEAALSTREAERKRQEEAERQRLAAEAEAQVIVEQERQRQAEEAQRKKREAEERRAQAERQRAAAQPPITPSPSTGDQFPAFTTSKQAMALAVSEGVTERARIVRSWDMEGVRSALDAASDMNERFDMGPMFYFGTQAEFNKKHYINSPNRMKVRGAGSRNTVAGYASDSLFVKKETFDDKRIRTHKELSDIRMRQRSTNSPAEVVATLRRDLGTGAPTHVFAAHRHSGFANEEAAARLEMLIRDDDWNERFVISGTTPSVIQHELGHRFHEHKSATADDYRTAINKTYPQGWSLLIGKYASSMEEEYAAEAMVAYVKGEHDLLAPAVLASLKRADRFEATADAKYQVILDARRERVSRGDVGAPSTPKPSAREDAMGFARTILAQDPETERKRLWDMFVPAEGATDTDVAFAEAAFEKFKTARIAAELAQATGLLD